MSNNTSTPTKEKRVIKSFADLKQIVETYPVARTLSPGELSLLLPRRDTLNIQTGAVTVQSKKSCLILPTLLSFDRSSKMLVVPDIQNLAEAVAALSAVNMYPHEEYMSRIRHMGRLVDCSHDAATKLAGNENGNQTAYQVIPLYLLIYPLVKGVILSWKKTIWTTEECKSFLSNKGFLQIPRYTIKPQK